MIESSEPSQRFSENQVYPRVTVIPNPDHGLLLNKNDIFSPPRHQSMRTDRLDNNDFELIEGTGINPQQVDQISSNSNTVSNHDTQLSLQEKVFVKLLNDEICEN